MALAVALDTSFAGINLTGVGKYSRRLVEGMRALSVERDLRLSCFGPACREPDNKLPLRGLYQEWPTYTQIYLPVRLALARSRVRVIHSTSHLGPLWGPGRRVVTVHDLIFKRFPSDYSPGWLRITEALLPHVLKRATAIIADSGATRDDLEMFYPQTRGKVCVIYPGIDEAFGANIDEREIRALRARHRLGAQPYVLCLGPWVRRKNISVVIEAFGAIAEEIPDISLVITGVTPPGMRGGNVAEALARLPADIRQRVRTIGHVPWSVVPPLVKGAAVLTYPSLFEGFGLPPLEAMSAGTPVIASDTPAVAEAAGEAALLVPPTDVGKWREALTMVLTNAQEATLLREAGLRWSASFSWRRCCEETANLYFAIGTSDSKRPQARERADSNFI